MRAWILIAVLAASACGDKKPPPPKNEFEAFEQAYVVQYETLAKAMRKQGKEVADKDIPTDYRAVYIGPPGVFVDRKLVATLPELEAKRADLVAALDVNAKLLPTIGLGGPLVTLDLGPAPAATAIQALRLFAGRATSFYLRGVNPEVPTMASHLLCGPVTLRDAPSAEPDTVKLSVFLDTGRTWVGLSRVNEYEAILSRPDGPDVEKLKVVLRQHKTSAFFTDRTDIELAASAGLARDVLDAFDAACYAGFLDVAVLLPAQLSARPQL